MSGSDTRDPVAPYLGDPVGDPPRHTDGAPDDDGGSSPPSFAALARMMERMFEENKKLCEDVEKLRDEMSGLSTAPREGRPSPSVGAPSSSSPPLLSSAPAALGGAHGASSSAPGQSPLPGHVAIDPSVVVKLKELPKLRREKGQLPYDKWRVNSRARLEAAGA